MNDKLQALADEAKAIINTAEKAGRPLTADEKARVKSFIAEMESAKADIELRQKFEGVAASSPARVGGGEVTDGTAYGLIKAAGWDLRTKPHVEFDGFKAFSTDGENTAPLGPGEVAAIGRDTRYAYQALPIRNIGQATLIREITQSARSLAAPEDMDLDYQGSSTKPTSTVTVQQETFEPVWVATVSEAIPNSLAVQDKLRDFINAELGHAVALGIDDHVLDSLTGATGTLSQALGADTVLDFLRKMKSDLVNAGHRATHLLINPTDWQTVELSKTADDDYYAGGAFAGPQGTVWGVRVVESASVTQGSPIMVDASEGGFGYVGLGQSAFDADPYSGFTANTTKFRVEVPAVVVVLRGEGIVLGSGM